MGNAAWGPFRPTLPLPFLILGLLTLPAPAPAQFAQRTREQTTLGQMSKAFRELVDRVSPSVVQIITSGAGASDEDAGDEGETGATQRQKNSGSGVIVDPAGYIVTNAHVVSKADRIRVLLSPRVSGRPGKSVLRPRGKIVRADVVGVDSETDLAVLKINEAGLPALEFGDSEQLAQGDIVLAFGSPLGLENSANFGIVSSKARQLRREDPMIYIQTDAAINPGNSGGPLVNTDGQVVGINTLILSQSGGSEGLGFAAPSGIVRTIYAQIRKSGRVSRGVIGVRAQTITLEMAAGLRLAQGLGVILGDVYPNGPADRAGLRSGDVIAALDDKPMENGRQLEVDLYGKAAGSTVRLEVLRGQEKLTVHVAVVERSSNQSRFSSMVTRENNLIPPLGILGIDLTPQLREMLPPLRKALGVMVVSVLPDSPILDERFQPGDIVYSVNLDVVANLADLRAALGKLKTGDPMVIQIERQGVLQYLTLEMP